MKITKSSALIKVTVELSFDEIQDTKRDLQLLQKFVANIISYKEVEITEKTINKLLNLFNEIKESK